MLLYNRGKKDSVWSTEDSLVFLLTLSRSMVKVKRELWNQTKSRMIEDSDA